MTTSPPSDPHFRAGRGERNYLLLAFALGALSVTGYAPLGWYPVPVLSLAVFFALLGPASPGQTLRLGFGYGLGLFLAGLSWVYVSMTVYGGMPLPLALLATVLFCAYLALYPALAAWLAARLASGAWRLTLALPAAWVLGEWLRGWLFTGLPWLALGYTQAPHAQIVASPLAGYAPLLGVYGVSLATALVAGLLACLVPSVVIRRAHGRRGFLPDLAVHAPRQPSLQMHTLSGHERLPHPQPLSQGERGASRVAAATCMGLAIVLLLAGWGLQQIDWTRPQGAPVAVALLQGNVPQDMKFQPQHVRAALQDYARQVEASSAQLIILPETALPMLRSQLPAGYLDQLAGLARRRGADVVVGLPEDEGKRYFNSAVSLGSSPPSSYRKVHLVPFGEFVPWGFRWFVDLMQIPLGDFGRGRDDQPPMPVAGQKLALNVCYEDVFGEERIAAARDASLLVNISNDAWFGASLAPWQHLQIGAMRSLETGRWQLRANNTGVTAVLDHRGRVRGQLPLFTQARLETRAQGHSGLTPYARWGNRPALLLSLGLLGLAAWRARRHPSAVPPRTMTAST